MTVLSVNLKRKRAALRQVQGERGKGSALVRRAPRRHRAPCVGPASHGAALGALGDMADAVHRLARRFERGGHVRSEEHTSELQSLMRISYAVFCLKKKKQKNKETRQTK